MVTNPHSCVAISVAVWETQSWNKKKIMMNTYQLLARVTFAQESPPSKAEPLQCKTAKTVKNDNLLKNSVLGFQL
jgi:hypothetical protein